MLSSVVEEAMRQQESSKRALSDLQEAAAKVCSVTVSATQAINSAARTLPADIEAAIDKKLKDSAETAANTMVAQWDRANLAAERAGRLYSLTLHRILGLAGALLVIGLLVGPD